MLTTATTPISQGTIGGPPVTDKGRANSASIGHEMSDGWRRLSSRLDRVLSLGNTLPARERACSRKRHLNSRKGEMKTTLRRIAKRAVRWLGKWQSLAGFRANVQVASLPERLFIGQVVPVGLCLTNT